MLNITADLPDDIFGLQTSLRADIRYKGSFYEDQLNYLERVPVATVNVSANMRNENWNVRLFINNLTNNDEPLRTQAGNLYIDQANPTIAPPNNGTWLAFKRRPREIGLQLGYNF
jgi:outer membrane receptor protein involved in Fe transport